MVTAQTLVRQLPPLTDRLTAGADRGAGPHTLPHGERARSRGHRPSDHPGANAVRAALFCVGPA
ncbi:hypothetical protein ACF061_19380 [Streptomyces sp. NPDC015220]|uniref:hypothetical protein n=1 Tax=Streptomyces sp. NPDC015220 TaxID=3364947 RepID=UPI0036FE9B94